MTHGQHNCLFDSANITVVPGTSQKEILHIHRAGHVHV